jgi:DNA primase
MIPQNILDQIQDRSDIVEVIQRAVPLKRAGRGFSAPCPFHSEKTPSFTVSPDKQIFHCFGCGAGGNVFTFVMKYDKLTFPEAVRQLAQSAGVLLPEDEEFRKKEDSRQPLYAAVQAATEFFRSELTKTAADAPVRKYIAKRRLTDEALSKFKIGYSPEAWDALLKTLARDHGVETLTRAGLLLERENKSGHYDRFRNRMMFPITDLRGRVIGFGARVLDDSLPKYVNSPESEIYHKGRVLYGFYEGLDAIRHENRVLLVEGYMDVIGCHAAGVEIAAAASGTSLTTDQIRALKRFTSNVTVLFDADKAGEAATLRGLDLLVEENCTVNVATLTDGHDPDSFVREFGAEKFRESVDAAVPLFDYKYQLLARRHDARQVEGKVRIAAEMLSTIRRIPNEITKHGYLSELSRRLGISEDALKVELAKASTSPRPVELSQPDQKAAAAAKARGPVRTLEKQLLGFLMHSAKYWQTGVDRLTLEDFAHNDARVLAKMIFEASDWQEIEEKRILNTVQDQETVKLLVSQAAHEVEILDDTDRAFAQCLQSLEGEKKEQMLQRLRREMAEAEKARDTERLKVLQIEYVRHTRKGRPNGTEVQTQS